MIEPSFIEVNQQIIAELNSKGAVIKDAQDALEFLANAGYQGARSIILYESNLTPEFFDLRTGIAGDILLKFSTYQMKLAVVGNFNTYKSISLKAFINECNRGNQIFFVPDKDSAITRITRKTGAPSSQSEQGS